MAAELSPAKLLERDVARQVKDFLRWRQWRIVRHQVAVASGGASTFSVGEKGMADLQAVYYFRGGHGLTLTLWIETKRPGKPLKPHQIEWKAKEEARGACVWKVDNIDAFERAYNAKFGWLHRGDTGHGQRELVFADVPGELVPLE